MIRKTTLLFTILFIWIGLNGQTAIQNPFSRNKLSLSGKWHYIVDLYESGYYNYKGIPKEEMENPPLSDAFFLNFMPTDKTQRVEYQFDASPTMVIPGDWNTQAEKLFYFEGSLWFKKSFDYQKSDPANRLFVHFGAANYRTDVYVNGKKIGMHEGGFTPFTFEITEHVKPTDNFMVIRVDNQRKKERVPALNADWWNYGGITRDLFLVETPPVFVRDYKIQLEKGSLNNIKGVVQLNGEEMAGTEVQVNIPELSIQEDVAVNEDGYGAFDVVSDKIDHWSPENPKLYEVLIKTADETITDRIGFRTIEVKGQDILLNGEPVFLRGISMHEENPIRGNRNFCQEDAIMMLTWAKELGCNFVRLAHYPHNEYMVRLADEMGLMVWAEDPVYWNILFDSKETYNIAENMLKELISRDKNRASVIIWSMANETPERPARNEFLINLANTARELDNTRLISAALLFEIIDEENNIYTINDPMADVMDIISFNAYIGWYDGLPDKAERVTWKIKQNKPVIVSEFGAGALQGYHGDSLTRWTEEFQEYAYRENIKMFEQIPQLRGISPWILADFRSPKRFLPNIQDGWNRKGLISETGDKKKAFYVLQEYYKSKRSK
jgi:beta-glucuronidase